MRVGRRVGKGVKDANGGLTHHGNHLDDDDDGKKEGKRREEWKRMRWKKK